jgi:hypothetical protein
MNDDFLAQLRAQIQPTIQKTPQSGFQFYDSDSDHQSDQELVKRQYELEKERERRKKEKEKIQWKTAAETAAYKARIREDSLSGGEQRDWRDDPKARKELFLKKLNEPEPEEEEVVDVPVQVVVEEESDSDMDMFTGRKMTGGASQPTFEKPVSKRFVPDGPKSEISPARWSVEEEKDLTPFAKQIRGVELRSTPPPAIKPSVEIEASPPTSKDKSPVTSLRSGRVEETPFKEKSPPTSLRGVKHESPTEKSPPTSQGKTTEEPKAPLSSSAKWAAWKTKATDSPATSAAEEDELKNKFKQFANRPKPAAVEEKTPVEDELRNRFKQLSSKQKPVVKEEDELKNKFKQLSNRSKPTVTPKSGFHSTDESSNDEGELAAKLRAMRERKDSRADSKLNPRKDSVPLVEPPKKEEPKVADPTEDELALKFKMLGMKSPKVGLCCIL